MKILFTLVIVVAFICSPLVLNAGPGIPMPAPPVCPNSGCPPPPPPPCIQTLVCWPWY
jgi:hypothetical protein